MAVEVLGSKTKIKTVWSAKRGIYFQKSYSCIYLDDMFVANLMNIDRLVISLALSTDIIGKRL